MGSVLKEEKNKNIILSSIPTRQYINNAIQSSNVNPKMTLMPSKFRNADGATTFSVGRTRFLKTFIANKVNNINDLTKKYQELGYNCKINCEHLTGSVYVSATGSLHPCCYQGFDLPDRSSVALEDFDSIKQTWNTNDVNLICGSNCKVD